MLYFSGLKHVLHILFLSETHGNIDFFNFFLSKKVVNAKSSQKSTFLDFILYY